MNYLSNVLPMFGHSNGEVSDPLPNTFNATLTFVTWGVSCWSSRCIRRCQASGVRATPLFWPHLLASLFNVGWLLALSR